MEARGESAADIGGDEFAEANEAKATFDDEYQGELPHRYLKGMCAHGYEIGERCAPFVVRALELLREHTELPLHMVDLGCSYGIGAALVKHGLSFEELADWFLGRRHLDRAELCRSTRDWLASRDAIPGVHCVGLDASAPAVRFAEAAGLLDAGIARNLEEEELDALERALLRRGDVLMSTGVIGYVGEATFERLLREFGRARPHEFGPLVVMTVLRMFGIDEIRPVFERFGMRLEVLSGARLPQRRFADDAERRDILAILHEKGVDTRGWEDLGRLYADVVIGAPERDFRHVLAAFRAAAVELCEARSPVADLGRR